MSDVLAEKQWYVVNTYSGHEQKVKTNLERRIVSMGMQDFIFNVSIAEQEVPILKDDKPTGKTKKKNMFPGYVYVEMIMSDAAWYVVRNTPQVTGFVGSSGGGTKPIPVPREQIEPVLKLMGLLNKDMYTDYTVGTLVKITHGPLAGSEGSIVEVFVEQAKVRVSVLFFGRVQEVEIDFADIEKI